MKNGTRADKTAIFICINSVMIVVGLFFTLRSLILKGLTVTNTIGILGISVFGLNLVLYMLLKSLYIPSLLLLIEVTTYILFSMFAVNEFIPFIAAALWMLTIPMLVFFLLGLKRGLIFIGISLLCSVILIMIKQGDFSTANFHPLILYVTFAVLFIFATLFFALYEQSQNKIQRQLLETNEDLKRSVDQLVHMERLSAMGEVTAGIVHELKQPLNNINIICQSVLRDVDKQRYDETEIHNDLSDVIQEVNKVSAIIDHIRVYARRTEGIAKEIISINQAIINSLKFVRQQLVNSNIELITVLHKKNPPIKGLAIQVEQVVLNLVNNARYALEACNKKSKRIIIKTGLKAQPHGDQVIIEVIDNGPGIPEEIRDKIFQPFFTTKAEGAGTGLGLSVTKRIVDEHGGRIELADTAESGAAFMISLPLFRPGD